MPARTRFAPSPTGYLHWGSLRTAFYNYLLAKSTGGQFILRLEDTDRTRLIPGAEQNIYETLKWCGLKIDEGPNNGGPYGPYRQSDRVEIYHKHAQILLEKGLAYKCFCSKDRLADLRESASQLQPPTTVTYDRKCLRTQNEHANEHEHEQDNQRDYVIRFKSPEDYPTFTDLLHGSINLQPQYNQSDRRYDDIVIVKSDGLPTYHFANVVDDHLMEITHVIRGEEWLASTPRHIAMYHAFGWDPPQFVHIPLLTSLGDKKLSKRKGDMGILSVRDQGVLPQAVLNFVALFGWSPHRNQPGVKASETFTLDEMESRFSLDNLTRGNAKVSESKLYFLNKQHLNAIVADPESLSMLVESFWPHFDQLSNGKHEKPFLTKLLKTIGPSLTTLLELGSDHAYTYRGINYAAVASRPPSRAADILAALRDAPGDSFTEKVAAVVELVPGTLKKDVFHSVRFALSGGAAGLAIPILIELLGETEYLDRLHNAIIYLRSD